MNANNFIYYLRFPISRDAIRGSCGGAAHQRGTNKVRPSFMVIDKRETVQIYGKRWVASGK